MLVFIVARSSSISLFATHARRCFTTKKGFPTRERELRTTFNFLANQEGVISHEDIRSLVLKWDPEYAESDIAYMFNRLDLDESGAVSWAEFKRIFGMQANE
jgi:Ca2+-binding EF-hand superfamily protein